MRIIDLTRDLSKETIVYPDDRIPEIRQIDHDRYRISELDLSSHSGTHIDAPAHFIPGGKTIDEIPWDHLVGPVNVLDMTGISGSIEPAHLEGRITGATRVLLRTSFSSSTSFSHDFPHLSEKAAEYLINEQIICIGIDSPSIEGFHGNGKVHQILLGRAVAIIEQLDLSDVREGDYYMVALPLKLKNLDGSPARVILFDDRSGGDGDEFS